MGCRDDAKSFTIDDYGNEELGRERSSLRGWDPDEPQVMKIEWGLGLYA